MRLTTIALASALALSGTFAFAHTAHRHLRHHGTVGMSSGRSGSDNPNGTAGGRTSLSGTGSSQFGGSVPGNTGKN